MVLASICNVAMTNKHNLKRTCVWIFGDNYRWCHGNKCNNNEATWDNRNYSKLNTKRKTSSQTNWKLFYNNKWEPIGPMTNLNDGLKLELSSSSLVNHQNSNGEIESNIVIESSLQDHITFIFWWQNFESIDATCMVV